MTLDNLNQMIKKLSVEELISEFQNAMNTTVECISKMATIWVELIDRGYDMKSMGFDRSFIEYLPQVASGKIRPEVMLRYSSSPGLIEAIGNAREDVQIDLSRPNATVPVLMSSGKTENLRVAGVNVSTLARQIIDHKTGGIRTIEEQRHFLPPKRPVTPAPVGRDEPETDAEFLAQFDLLTALNDAQQEWVMNKASAIGLTPAQFAVDCIRRCVKGMPGKAIQRPVDRKAEARREARPT